MSTSTTTSTLTKAPSPSHSRLQSSTSSLSSSQTHLPNVTRIYKQASELFLTRRVREAFDVLEPLLRKRTISAEDDANIIDDSARPPIATASRAARVKAWSLYMSILNEVAGMRSVDGKKLWGSSRWTEMVAKTKDGAVWEAVVREGYGGVEGNVDADVVANLATLLLAHAPSQKLTQQRLETYLSSSTVAPLNLASHTELPDASSQSYTGGASTSQHLDSRLRILEIYTLHVLPRNEEWGYARDFIKLSEILDEDRREAFLQALQALQDEQNFGSKKEQELQRQQEQQASDSRRKEEDVRITEDEKAKQQEKNRKQQEVPPSSECDYGLDQPRVTGSPKPGIKATATAGPTSALSPSKPKSSSLQPSRPSAPGKKPKALPSALYKRMSLSMTSLQQAIRNMGQSLVNNPMALLRIVLFLIALLTAIARRDVRDRLVRVTRPAWDKIRATVGMGVKVSYI